MVEVNNDNESIHGELRSLILYQGRYNIRFYIVDGKLRLYMSNLKSRDVKDAYKGFGIWRLNHYTVNKLANRLWRNENERQSFDRQFIQRLFKQGSFDA